MNSYRSYMDALELSPQRHDALMHSLRRASTGRRRVLRRAAPLAACLVLVAAFAVLWPRLPVKWRENVFPPSGVQGGELPEAPTMETVDFAAGSRPEESSFAIALPDGYFFADMTQEQMARMLGSGERLSGLLGWEADAVTGRIIYGGDGEVYRVDLTGKGLEGAAFTMQLSPGRLPPVCVNIRAEHLTTVGGVETEASCWHYDIDGDGNAEYVYRFSMLPGEVGLRFEAVGEERESVEQLATLAANWCARWTDGLTMEHLVPESIPQWRHERLEQETQARAEDLGAYLPAYVPQGFAFEGAWRELGQDRDFLSACWYSGLREISVTVSRPQEQPRLMDVSRPELYDVRLYEIPWSDSVPEAAWEAGFDDPVFAAEHVTAGVVAARLYEVQEAGDADGYRLCMSVWHENGTLVSYTLKGLTAQQAERVTLGE